MMSVDMFRRTRLHNTMLIAPKPKPVKIAQSQKAEFKPEKSVFIIALLCQIARFSRHQEYYDRSQADSNTRAMSMVGGKAEYDRIVDILCEHYKCIREAFRFHVRSRGRARSKCHGWTSVPSQVLQAH